MKKKNIKSIFYLLVSTLLALVSCNNSPSELSLAGEWKFALDPDNIGVSEQWQMKELSDKVQLPGSLQEQGKGDDVGIHTQWTGSVVDKSWYTADEYAKYREPGNIKVPFWLNPDKYYVGVAWYQKEIEIPESWSDKRILLEFERTHWETSLYIDGNKISHQDALQVPHRYLINSLAPGKHLLSLRVDNRVHIDVGSNAHSVSDHTQTNWNGVIGEIKMQALPALAIDHIQVYPDAKAKKATVKVYMDGKPAGSRLALNVLFEGQSILEKEIDIEANAGNSVETTIEWKDNVKLWSEFTPNVYRLQAVLFSRDGVNRKDVNFGFRELKANGTHFDINGRPIFLRGTLECCVFPKTGYPAMDNEYWAKIYATCKSYGLNHVRFHSWCPPAAAFHVADSMGVYLQVECGGWTSVGDGNKQDQWIKEESIRILNEYGNHPSFCLLAYGNEPSGNNQVNYLNDLVVYWKQHDGRRLYTSAGGWPLVPDADYYNTDKPRIGGIGRIDNILNVYTPRTDYDFRERILEDMPVVSHEVGQWCVYPDFKEIDKYTGVLKAKNFEIFKETLNEKGLGDMADKFLYASGRLQTLCYKMDIEAALRTPGFAGFQLLDLHDFPGQGTALVGVLNPFWESKGYVDGKEYSEFCNQTVPLARMPKLIWNNNEQFKANIEFAHFGEKPLQDASILWNVETKEGNVVKSGSFRHDLPIGNLIEAGSIEFPLNTFTVPTQLTLKVNVENTEIANSWNIWVYPARKKEIQKMPYITYKLDKTAIDKLNQGENVLFLSYGKIAPKKRG
ncbi:beta-galactosidase [Parabacteroides faecis]|uniref:sugar-binding domain-containing protein n=1 Tax=Parabacteroides faecis TaxID=1217282 RepID=UPI00216437F9|nr:sugar-binding domain-containing protein [Parabacteroides faecis]UVQ45559.1 beta-galactosidase [Parabacteroides faecis]